MHKIGQRIKERRKELDMTADELGRRIGKNRATVYRYENGDIENLPIDVLKPIAKALDIAPQYLMGWNIDTEATSKKTEPTVDFLMLHDGDVMTVVEAMSSLSPKSREELMQFAEFLKSKEESKND